MADSDCSNCINQCKFVVDDHYTCYKKQVEEIKKLISKKEIADFRNFNYKLTTILEKTDYNQNILFDLKDNLSEIITMYDEVI